MPTASAPDFRLYYSNALDVLAAVLAEELRQPVPGASPLVPDTVLIPQAAMRRWLQATLAQRHGVVANLEFLAPGEFVTRVLDANVPAAEADLDPAALQWRLYAALADPALLAKPALARIARYLDGFSETEASDAASRSTGQASASDPLKAWTLAGELAAVFEKYQAWRRPWLLRWQAGADADDPQAILWRAVAGGRSFRARRIHEYLGRFEGADRELPVAMPPRLFCFAALNVSPDVLRVIATQARVGTTHFYMPTPSEKYWGDLQTLRLRLRAGEPDPLPDGGGDNRLLQAWGAAGRDFMAVLGSHELVHPSGEIQAHADPAGDPGPGLAEGGLSDSLLRRLQADLHHRRPPPPAQPSADDPRSRLPDVRRNDPSLQIHACHTRLRELQVLHDQLRGLFDDPRFQPPLQPRDVAVLAPDIDLYAPYLGAVFGGGGEGERIPYAVADTSPLAGEPLAELFVHLLGLPVSRFGLTEILDLLGSAAIAEAVGLDAPALERVRTWLHAAGARWGLDARHRRDHLRQVAGQTGFDGVRPGDAHTWQFSLDRLLLGHATGADDDLVGADGRQVAPMPDLEGGALDALDTLIRLLRVLARQQRSLAEALTPTQWRERLLALLNSLLPVEPTDATTRRTLDRLRLLIDDFARRADEAGYDEPVPAAIVRHQFTAALGEADTRAPLLTGGVSFGRMVPMRLLPFRVLCVLGLNDGDYPRRDPAAGLNRLTAAVASGQREYGDRSTREDDRFLFLQLLAAAQDVFYLSYQGADPRDGSVREPSVLVSELLDEAARQHADPQAAARDLVVRHPLQPFSAAVFGGADEPRRYSYRSVWQAAATAGTRQRRQPVPPWFTAPLPVVDDEGEAGVGAELSIDALRRFLLAPAEQFLSERLRLRLAPIEAVADDREPLLAPTHGLERHHLLTTVFDSALRGIDENAILARLRARGLLPAGAIGREVFEAGLAEVRPYVQAFATWRGDQQAESPRLTLNLDGVRLHGRVAEVYPHGIARLRFGPRNGRSVIRNGLDWLFASAAGMSQPLSEFHAGDDGVGPFERPALSPEQAQAVLAHLLALRARGLREPLPFAPSSGWALFQADDPEAGLKAAAGKWRGGGDGRGHAEGDDDALRLALRGHDPFRDEAAQRAFVAAAYTIFHAVENGTIVTDADAAARMQLWLPDDEEGAE